MCFREGTEGREGGRERGTDGRTEMITKKGGSERASVGPACVLRRPPCEALQGECPIQGFVWYNTRFIVLPHGANETRRVFHNIKNAVRFVSLYLPVSLSANVLITRRARYARYLSRGPKGMKKTKGCYCCDVVLLPLLLYYLQQQH